MLNTPSCSKPAFFIVLAVKESFITDPTFRRSNLDISIHIQTVDKTREICMGIIMNEVSDDNSMCSNA